MDSTNTKRTLAMSLKALLKEQPLSKISIGEICDLCSMSRKSFYYHFKDKEDLISWIFDTEFEEACKEKTRVIDTLIKYFYENKSFYKKVLKEEGQNSFSDHLYSFCCALMEDTFKNELGIKELNRFQIGFFADGFVCTIKRWMTSYNAQSPDELARQINESFSVSHNLKNEEKTLA